MANEPNEIEQRVAREKEAHDDRDVLSTSYKLKQRFVHFFSNPSLKKMEADIMAMLADVDNKDILEYGCGTGKNALDLLKRGARVTGIDISENYIAEAKLLASAEAPHSCYSFKVMDAHKLEFPDCSFDFLIGRGILHHLDYRIALPEIMRVLRPGGSMIIQEPLGSNPLLRLFRIMTPHARTDDEKPFFKEDLNEILSYGVDGSHYYGILCAPVAIFTSVFLPFLSSENYLLQKAFKIEMALNKFPKMRPYNQYVLLSIVKK